MQKFFHFFLILILLQAGWNCQKNSKKLSDSNLFVDGIQSSSGLTLFTLLDPYPVLKQPFKSMSVYDFNTRLDNSLRVSPKEDILGVLRLTQNILLNTQTELQTLLAQTSNMLSRIQRNNPTAYENIQPVLERIRYYHQPVIRNIIPITTDYLHNEYLTRSATTINRQVLDFANTLANDDSKVTLEDYQDLVVKGIRLNPVIRGAVEDATNAFLDPIVSSDKKLKNGLIGTIYGIGEMLFKRSGPAENLTSETTIKRLMVNMEKYFTIGGSGYTATYSTNYTSPVVINSTELNTVFVDLYTNIRQLIVPPAVPTTKDPTAILIDKLGENLQLLDFAGTTTGIENSLMSLILQDSNGKNRYSNPTTAYPVSALESLLLTLGVVDNFGYAWNTTTFTNAYITGISNGQLNLGDSLWALQSTIAGDPLGFKKVLKDSKDSGKVFKNGITLTGTNGIDLNTPELALLDTESIGAALPIESPGTDAIYRKTIPWVLNWIIRATYSGYGPYYNKNKKDSSGNFLSPDVAIARYANLGENRYNPTWQTANYKVCVSNTTTTLSNCKDIGMGGREYAGQSASGNPANSGTGFTIYEISKSNDERAVNSDEEAFYKNFQWLLYEKRFVVIIPALASLSGTAFRESLFIIAIGNGLKGMMSLKPYCSGDVTTCNAGNGLWLKNTSISLKNNTTSYQDLTTAKFSNIAGDSVVYIEGWGYGFAGDKPFQEAELISLVWQLMIPYPTQVFGLIPPVISFNFPVLEKLGFTGTGTVLPASTSANWDNRNKLLPLIVALAKALDDQVDVATNKNPYTLLTDLSKTLSRPFFYIAPDQYSGGGTPNIVEFRTAYGDSIRNPNAVDATDYQANSSVFSPISFLVESQRRFQDGILVLVAKTDLITNLVQMFVAMGLPAKKTGKDKILLAVQQILGEIKIDSDGVTAPNQYNLQLFVSEKITKLAAYPDTRSTDVTTNDWTGVDESLAFVRDYFSKTSGYSIVKNIDFIIGMIIDIGLSNNEVYSLLEMLDSLLTKEANGKYYLTNVLTDYVPPVLRQAAPYGRNLFGLFYGLAIPGGFFNYTENNMTFAPFTVKELISDLERFLNSEMVTSTAKTSDALFYSSGVLISLFADIYEYGRRLEKQGFPFADGLNVNEEMTAWDRLNIILSIK